MPIDGDALRRTLTRFMELRGLQAKPWARSAGVGETAISNFLNRHSKMLNFGTLKKLADSQHVSVAVLTGEIPDPEEQPQKPTVNQPDDVLIPSSDLTGDDVQNLQLMVARLGQIGEHLIRMNEKHDVSIELLKRLVEQTQESPTDNQNNNGNKAASA